MGHIEYPSYDNYDRNVHYLRNREIYFFTTYYMSVYYITYNTLYHTQYDIVTAEDKYEYKPPNKGM